MSESDGTFRSFSKGFVKDYTDLLAYRKSFQLSKEIFEMTKNFPKEEMYSLTDQFRRAIRSVGANIAEAWGKRRYGKHFVSKLTDADAERLETQHWLRTSYACEYVTSDQAEKMNERLLEIGRLLNGMIERSSAFVIGDDRLREDPLVDEFF
ncbi:MAG: four helix bundle protein [Verrucomicrobia bacterium]|nr:four helix bundle protein [Verrucomicrobiota bacterium]